MISDKELEEKRFREAVKRSWDAVWAVAQYLHSCGNLSVRVGPLVIRPDFDSRDGYGDAFDLSVCLHGSERWWPVEAKRRELAFTSSVEYPYDTIFVDRSVKADASEPYAYFILNRSLSHAALIRGATKARWIGPNTYPDSVKGYPVCVYECPKDLAEFVTLR